MGLGWGGWWFWGGAGVCGVMLRGRGALAGGAGDFDGFGVGRGVAGWVL